MSLKDFIGKSGEQDEAGGSSERPLAVPRSVAPATSVDANTRITGKIICKETLRIDGRVKGEVRCDKTVIIGEQAKVDASIDADAIIIFGEVKGDVNARRKITLERTARMTGDLATPGIVIEEGAKLKGRIVIGAEEESSAKQQPASRTAAQAEGSATRSRAPSPGVSPPTS